MKKNLKEFGDLKFSFPFKEKWKYYVDDNKKNPLFEIVFTFSTEKINYLVEFVAIQEDADVPDNQYLFDFKTNTPGNEDFGELTNENISFKIISTVANILKYIISTYKLMSIPILIKGSSIKGKENYADETSRDRIYKYIAKKNITFFKNYSFQDLGSEGFQLIPKKQSALVEKILIEGKEILKEIGDLNNTYSFEIEETEFSNDDTLYGLKFTFKSEKYYYIGFFQTYYWYDDSYYQIDFKTITGHYDDFTNEKNAVKIITTVASILVYIINNYKLSNIPIKIKGTAKPDTGEKRYQVTQRDRIYSYIGQKIIKKIPNYIFKDKGDEGFELIPKNNLVTEHILKEIGESNFSFPFKVVREKLNFEKNTIAELDFQFETDKNVYFVKLEIADPYLNPGYKNFYVLAFYATQQDYNEITNENIPFRIISTITQILKFIINNYDLESLPIIIKGQAKENEKSESDFLVPSKETSRDRLYKQFAKKQIDSLTTYSFHDLGNGGFELIPKKQLQLAEKKSKSESNYKYGCVMLNVSLPINELQSKINKNDLYEVDNDKYGLETKTHITLLYGLHKEVKNEEVKQIIDSFIFPSNIILNKISIFDTDEKYDVLKFDIENNFLKKVNLKLRELPYTSDYSDYQPHMTICYLKKGIGKNYVEKFKNIKNIQCKTDSVLFKTSSGEKNNIKIKKKENLSEKILKEFLNIEVVPPPILKKIKDTYGITKELGSGVGGGTAFLTKNNMVVKLTNDIREINFYLKVQKHNYKHFVKVYDIKKFSFKPNINYPHGDSIWQGYIVLKDYANKLLSRNETFWFYSFLESGNSASIFIKNNNLKNDKHLVEFIKQLSALKKELHIDYINDIASNNVGWKGNNLVAFDLEAIKKTEPKNIPVFESHDQ